MMSFSEWRKAISKWIIENFLVFCFSIVIIFALSYPFPGIRVNKWKLADHSIVQFTNTCIVFFISGLTLKVEECSSVALYAKGLLYGIFSINFLTTLLAPIFLSCSFIPSDFRIGLAIFSCVPTTLGVGVALTQLSKGDVLLGLLLTVISNTLGSVTTPFLLTFYLTEIPYGGESNSFSFDSISLLIDLLLTVLIPTVVGILIRVQIPSTKQFTKTFKTELSMFSTINLAIIIWMSLSKSREQLLKQKIGDIFVVLASVIIMHIFCLLFNAFIVRKEILNLEITQAITVIIMTSQKSNPVALAVINGMGLKSDQSGLLIIPGILGQVCQIFIGSLIARYFQTWVKKSDDDVIGEVEMYGVVIDEEKQGEELFDKELRKSEQSYEPVETLNITCQTEQL